MIQNILGLSIIYGSNSVIETLSSQAYGAGNKKLCGVYLYRGFIMLTLAYIPIVLILLQCERILLALGQDAEAAKYCQEYMIAFLPGLVILGYTDIHRRYLNSLGRNTVPLVALAVGTFSHYFVSKHFVITM